jgi:Domain of unknown function (DUF4189)
MGGLGNLRKAMHYRPSRLALLILFMLAATVACVAILRPTTAGADAALAVGLPGDVAKQGVAIGYAVNYDSREAAQAEALKRCRNFQDAPQATRDLCKIVENFRDRCMAIALDPEVGTTGLGWSVSKKQELAEEVAMERCTETSGKKRREFCRITYTKCDKKYALGAIASQHLARDHHAHDLVGALQDLMHAQVAHELLEPIVLQVAVTAMDLQGLVAHVEAEVGRQPLAHG